jgi:hypothetical protein
MQHAVLTHRLSTAALAALLTYVLGIVMMVLAYARPTDYQPPFSEYLAVPLVLAARHPLVVLTMFALSAVLIHVCRTVLARRKAA